MNTQFNLTLTITGASLDDIDNALIAAAGERLKSRLTKPLDFKVSGVPAPTNPTVRDMGAAANAAQPQRKPSGRRPGGIFNRVTRKYEYAEDQVENSAPPTGAPIHQEEIVTAEETWNEVEETQAEAEPEIITATTATPEQAVTALKMVNSKFNIDRAKACLDHFKVARCSELSETQRGAFVKYCEELR